MGSRVRKKMTPTEAGVREYCANTREKGNLRYSFKENV